MRVKESWDFNLNISLLSDKSIDNMCCDVECAIQWKRYGMINSMGNFHNLVLCIYLEHIYVLKILACNDD